MDRLRAMEVFIRVVERGSFKRAAEDLGLSYGMASIQVQQLERHLGVRLLARTTRRLKLTDEGHTFLDSSRRILADLAETEMTLAGVRAIPRGRLRVQVPMALGRLWLAPSIGQLLARHPELTLEMVARDRFPSFVDDGLDAGIYVGEVPEAGVVARSLGRFPLVTCAAPDYLARRGVPTTLADLARHDCINIVSTQTGRPLDWRFEQAGTVQLVPVGGRLAFDTSEAAVAAALSGAGLLQMISYLVMDCVARGELQVVLADLQFSGPPVSIVYPAARQVPAKLRAFVDFTVDLFRSNRSRLHPEGHGIQA